MSVTENEMTVENETEFWESWSSSVEYAVLDWASVVTFDLLTSKLHQDLHVNYRIYNYGGNHFQLLSTVSVLEFEGVFSACSSGSTFDLSVWKRSVTGAVLDWASVIIPPPVIVTGAVGNSLAAGLLQRLPPPLASDLSAARYAVALLVASTVRLLAEGTLEWFAYVTTTVYVMHQADWICRVWKFLLTTVKGCGAWLTIALAVDRLVYATAAPDVVTTVCSSCVSGVVLVGIAVGVVVVGMHDLWVGGSRSHRNLGDFRPLLIGRLS